jgi:polyisoprenoid-binding protein YceI
MQKVTTVLSALALFTFALSADAGGKKCKLHGKADTHFQATGLGGLKINGTCDPLTVNDDGTNLVLGVSLNNIKTGIDLRDKHAKKYMNAEKNPNVTFTVPRSALKFPEDGKTTEGKATGKFKLNEVTNDVPFTYKAKRVEGGKIEVKGTTTINYISHKIEEACYLGVCVKPNVDLSVNFKVEES